MGTYGALWCPMGPCGALWGFVAPCGALWGLVGPCGALWVPMGPYGALWGGCICAYALRARVAFHFVFHSLNLWREQRTLCVFEAVITELDAFY